MEERIDELFAGHLRRPAINIRIRQTIHFGRKWAEAKFVRLHLARQRQRQQGPAMKAVLKADNGGTFRVVTRDLHRVFHRLGAAVDQESFFGKAPRRHFPEDLRQVGVGSIRRDVKTGVKKLIGLILDRFDHFGRTVSHVQGSEPAGEIDVLICVDVRQERALRLRHEDRRHMEHSLRDVALALGHQPAADRSGNGGLDPYELHISNFSFLISNDHCTFLTRSSPLPFSSMPFAPRERIVRLLPLFEMAIRFSMTMGKFD